MPARFGVLIRSVLRRALDRDPRARASAEDVYYMLEKDRAARRHGVLPLSDALAAAREPPPPSEQCDGRLLRRGAKTPRPVFNAPHCPPRSTGARAAAGRLRDDGARPLEDGRERGEEE